MKLTAHLSINFPLLSVTSSLPGIGIPYIKGYSVNLHAGTGKGILIDSIPATGITDYKNNNLTLRNAGGNILFSTTLSKASVELPSLATGVYFVRVKNKVSGKATNLPFAKI